MSTRSTITVRTGANERKSIYCHFDGYCEGVGATLLQHYNTLERAKALIELGALSVLAENIEQSENKSDWMITRYIDGEFKAVQTDKPHSFDNKHVGVCVAYGRDRGETDVEAQVLTNSDAVDFQEYNYYFNNGKWYVGNRELTKEMCKI